MAYIKYTNGSFTLVTFVSKTVSDSDTWLYLPWPPWVTRHRKDHFYLCGSTQGGQGKYKCVAIACHCHQHCRATFANVNTALWKTFRTRLSAFYVDILTKIGDMKHSSLFCQWRIKKFYNIGPRMVEQNVQLPSLQKVANWLNKNDFQNNQFLTGNSKIILFSPLLIFSNDKLEWFANYF